MLASHLHKPCYTHLIPAKQALRHLKEMAHYDMRTKPDDGTQLSVDADASFVNDVVREGKPLGVPLMYENVVLAATESLQKMRQPEFYRG